MLKFGVTTKQILLYNMSSCNLPYLAHVTLLWRAQCGIAFSFAQYSVLLRPFAHFRAFADCGDNPEHKIDITEHDGNKIRHAQCADCSHMDIMSSTLGAGQSKVAAFQVAFNQFL